MPGQKYSKITSLAGQWLTFGVAVLAFGGVTVWHVHQDYIQVDETERERITARTRIVDENMARQLDSINQALSGIRDDLPYWKNKHDSMETLTRRLNAMTDAMPGVHSMVVLDAKGRVIASNKKQFTGQNFSNRECYQEPLQSPNPDKLYVSPPRLGASGVFTMSLSRAIIGPGGRLAGVVVASLEPEEFGILMNSVGYAPDMQAFLVHADGRVFMAVPDRGRMAGLMDIEAELGPVFSSHMKSGKASSVKRGIPVKGEQHLMVLRTIHPAGLHMSKPMVIAISRDLGAVFADWRLGAWQQGGLFGVLFLVSGVAMFAYQRRRRAYDLFAASHELDAERLKLATEATGMGVWEYDLVRDLLIWDDAMYTVYGVEKEKFPVTFKAWRDTLLPEDLDTVDSANRSANEEGKPYDICFHIRRGDGEVRTIHALAHVYFDESGKAVRVIGTNEDITDRQRVEDALRDSEARQSAILNNSPYLTWMKDTQGRYLKVNKAWADYAGLKDPGQVVGKTDFDLWPKELAEKYRTDDADVLASRRQKHVEELSFDGETVHWVETFKTPVIDKNGTVLGTTGFARDITERKQAEAELRIAAASFESQDGMIVTDANNAILRVNRAFTEITGYTAGDAVGQNPRMLKSGRHDAAFYAEIWKSISKKGAWHGEIWNRHKNGEICPERLTITAVKGDDGKVTHYVATLRDIADQKRTEETLRENEEKFRSIYEGSNDAFMLLSENGFFDCNSRTLEMFGLKSKNEFMGLSLPQLSPPTQPDGQDSIGVLNEKIATAFKSGVVRFNWMHRRKSGEEFPAEILFSAFDFQGRKVLLATVQDITERKQAEEQIRALAFYDVLTGLPNRRLLDDRLGTAMNASKRSGLYGALMFLDLDNFKPLNDTHGHEVGDLLLIEVAKRLTGCVREADTVARFGGDEFVVMLNELDEDEAGSAVQAGAVAEKIRAALAKPYVLKFQQDGNAPSSIEHLCTTSIGVALFIDHAASPEDILKWADMAMYQAKYAGRNRVHFHIA